MGKQKNIPKLALEFLQTQQTPVYANAVSEALQTRLDYACSVLSGLVKQQKVKRDGTRGKYVYSAAA